MTNSPNTASRTSTDQPRMVREKLFSTGSLVAASHWLRIEWVVATVTVLVFAVYFGLLAHLVFRGWAHSYDSAIYVRSLWGVAHGELFNPMVELHALSIHGNFVLFLLAPFAHFVHPAWVLIVAQAAAAAATAGMVSAAFRRIAEDAGGDAPTTTASALFGAFALVAGTPMVANPFLFDIRPDLIGVPLVTWGLLRAHRKGEFDIPAVVVMLLALLVREEFMIVIVGGLVATPFPRDPRSGLKLRVGGTAIAVGYWALYWFGFRNWIGDGSYEIAQEVGAAFLDDAGLTAGQSALFRVEIVLVFVLAAGGTCFVGRRWIGAALPGLALLLVSTRMQELVLNFHYVEFVVPGLAVASTAGFSSWMAGRRVGGAWAPLASSLVITGCFVVSSAFPGGGRYRAENFDLGAEEDAVDTARLRATYALLAAVPPDAALAAPHELAAPFADRGAVVPVNRYAQRVTPESAPEGIDWVALPGRDWSRAGRMLVEQHGFMLMDHVDGRLALLSRDPTAAPAWADSRSDRGDSECPNPVAHWPAAGVMLCGVEVVDGHLAVELVRGEPAGPSLRDVALAVVLVDPVSGARDVARMVDGLVPPSHLPVGVSGAFVSEHAIAGASGAADVALVVVGGAPVAGHIERGSGPAEDQRAVRVTW